MHAGAVFLTLAALASSAAAEPLHPWPHHSVGASLIGFGGGVGTAALGAVGPQLDLGLGLGRWQLGGSLALLWAFSHDGSSPGARPSLTARYLARSIEPDHSTALDFTLEGELGLTSYLVHDAPTARPEISVGVGMQVRALDRETRWIIRYSIRLLFSEPGPATAPASCRGTCAVPAVIAGNGILGNAGVSW